MDDLKKLLKVPDAPPYENSCLKAIARGEASKEQMKAGMNWIIHIACGVYDNPFVPGHTDVSDYRAGQRGAGLAIVREINRPLKENEEPKT